MPRIPIGGFQLNPDSSGSVFFEPYNVKATNDSHRHMVAVFDQHTSPSTLYGLFDIPTDYSSGGTAIPVWTTTATSGAVSWAFASRLVAGNDIESLDQSGYDATDTATDAAPSAANERLETAITMTPTLSANTTIEFGLSRQSIGGIAAAITLHNILFSYDT